MKKILFFILFFISFPVFSTTKSIIQIHSSIGKVKTSEFKSNTLYTINTNWVTPDRFFINGSLSILSNKNNQKKINWIPISVGIGKYFKSWYIIKPFTKITTTLNYIKKEKTYINITPSWEVGTLIKLKNNFAINLSINQHFLINEKNIRYLSLGVTYTLTPKNYKKTLKPTNNSKPSKRLKNISIKQYQNNE